MITEDVFWSPQKKAAVERLHQQEIDLNRQSQAIHDILLRLDKKFVVKRKNSLVSLQDKPHESVITLSRILNTYGHEFNDNSTKTVDLLSQDRKENIDPSDPVISGFMEVRKLNIIREEREETLKSRIKQRSETLRIMEETRLKAIEHARRDSALKLAAKHFFSSFGWKLLNKLYHRAKYRLNCQKAVVVFNYASYRLAMDNLFNNKTFYEYVGIQMRKARRFFIWRNMRSQFILSVARRKRQLYNMMLSRQYRIQSHCHKFFSALSMLLRRKRMTVVVMTVYFERYRKQHLLHFLHQLTIDSLTRRSVVDSHLSRRRIVLLRKAMESFNLFTQRELRKRLAIKIYVYKSTSNAFACLADNRSIRIRQQRARRVAECGYFFKNVSYAICQWSQNVSRNNMEMINSAEAMHRNSLMIKGFQQLLYGFTERERQTKGAVAAECHFKHHQSQSALNRLRGKTTIKRKTIITALLKQRRRTLSAGFRRLLHHTAHHPLSKRHQSVSIYYQKTTHRFLQMLLQHCSERILSHQNMRTAVAMHYFKSLHRALLHWRARTNRSGRLRGSEILDRQNKMFYLRRSAAKCFDRWMQFAQFERRINVLCEGRVARLKFKWFHYWRAMSHIRAVKRRGRLQLVPHTYLLSKGWRLFCLKMSIRRESIFVKNQARARVRNVVMRKYLFAGFKTFQANCAQRRKKYTVVRGGTNLHRKRYLRQGFEKFVSNLTARLMRKKKCGCHAGDRKSVMKITRTAQKVLFLKNLIDAVHRYRRDLLARRLQKLLIFRKFIERLKARCMLQFRHRLRKVLNARQLLLRRTAWTKWMDRKRVSSKRAYAVDIAKKCHRHASLSAALESWIQFTESVHSRKYLSSSRVKLSSARRRTFFIKWLQSTTSRTEEVAYLSRFSQHHNKRKLVGAWTILRAVHETKVEKIDLVRRFRRAVLEPLFKRRSLHILQAAIVDRDNCKLRRKLVTAFILSRALSQWSRIHNVKMQLKNKRLIARIGLNKHFQSRAVLQWRRFCQSRLSQRNSVELSQRYRTLVLTVPALRVLRNHARSQQSRKQSASAGNALRNVKAWRMIYNRWLLTVSCRRLRKQLMTRGKQLFADKRLAGIFSTFYTFLIRSKMFRDMKARAKAVHSYSLLFKTFRVLFQYYFESVAMQVRADVQYARQGCRKAIRRLKGLVIKRRVLKMAIAKRQVFQLRRAISVRVQQYHHVIVTNQRRIILALSLFRRRYTAKYLSKWLDYTDERRQVGFAERQAIRQRRQKMRDQLNRHYSCHAYLRYMYALRVNRRDRKYYKESVKNVVAVLQNLRCKQALNEWRCWLKNRRSFRNLVVGSVDVVDDSRLLNVFNVLSRNAITCKSFRKGINYHIDSSIFSAFSVWMRVALIQMKRVKHKRLHHKKRAVSFYSGLGGMTKSMSFVSVLSTTTSDFMDTASTYSDATTLTGMGSEAVIEHCGDFRVSTQNKRIVQATQFNHMYWKQYCMRRLIECRQARIAHRSLLSYIAYRQLKRSFRILRKLPHKNRSSLKVYNAAHTFFVSHQRLRFLVRLTETMTLNKLTRKMVRRTLSDHWKIWRSQQKLCGAMRRVVTSAKSTFNRYYLGKAFEEWVRVTASDRLAEQHADRALYLHFDKSFSQWIQKTRIDKRRNRKYSNAVQFEKKQICRKVFLRLFQRRRKKTINLLKIASEINKHKLYHRFVSNLRILRRHRVYRQFCLKVHYFRFKTALARVQQRKRLNRSFMIVGNGAVLLKALHRLRLQSKRSLQKKVIRRVRAVVRTVQKKTSMNVALSLWRASTRKRYYFYRLLHMIENRFLRHRRLEKLDLYHENYGIFVAFRKLLSYKRMRVLKRKNVVTLIKTQLALKLHHAFNKLDVADLKLFRKLRNKKLDDKTKRKTLLRTLHCLQKLVLRSRMHRNLTQH